MLQYVLRDSDSYRICLETDRLHTHPKQTTPSITNVSSAPVISRTSQLQVKKNQAFQMIANVEPMTASKSTEVTDGIAIVPPVIEEVDDHSKHFHKPSKTAHSATALNDFPDRDSYLKAIKEMYPKHNIDRLKSNMVIHEDWATTRAVAALKAFTTVKSMITDEKLGYAQSDDDDSDASDADDKPKKPKILNLDDKNKKVFLLAYQTALQCSLHLIPRTLQIAIVPLQVITNVGVKRILWNQF